MRIERNIPKLTFLRILRWFMLIIPIVVLFFQDNGLNMREVLILQSVFSVIIVILEIPSGYLADIIGRKSSIILATFFGTFGFISYSFSYGFIGFLLAEILLGIGASLISGADSAMLYDSLLQAGRADEYSKIEGRYQSAGNFSEGAASIVGGFLAAISLRLPIYLETGIMALTIPLAFSLIEPERETLINEKQKVKLLIVIVKDALFKHKELKWLILFSSLIGATTLTSVWFIQPYLKQAGLPIRFFGIVWAILQFSVGIFSRLAYRMEKRMGRKWGSIQLIVLNFAAFIILGIWIKLWAIPFLLLFYYVRGFSTPVFKDYINKLTVSNKRATVLSIKNMVGRLFFAIVGPFIGWINDIYSLSAAFYSAGAIYFVLGVFFLLMMKKNDILK